MVVKVTHQSYGSRLGGSIVGALVGVLMTFVGIGLLFWNEGRAVHRAQALEEGSGAVVAVKADQVDAGHEGHLVHLSGEATTEETLADPMFGVSETAIGLVRNVEMYQWVENQRSEERKKLGGGTETVTTYTYEKKWSDKPQSSASFEESAGHENPSWPFEGESWRAETVTLGAFQLGEQVASAVNHGEQRRVGEEDLANVSDEYRDQLQVADGSFYLGQSPGSPQIGDVRIGFSVVKPAVISVVAAQKNGVLEPYLTKVGEDLSLVEYGQKPADQMFQAAQDRNTMLTWILRLVGFLLLFIGILSVLKPLRVAADFIPFLGNLVGGGLAIAAFLVAAPIALITIAIGWVVYRPVLGIALLALAVVFVVWMVKRSRKNAPAMRQQPTFVPPPPPPAPAM